MRILLWNCNNGLSEESKIRYFNSFKPDLAVIPEINKANIDNLRPTEFVWITNHQRNPLLKGLGVLTFNDYRLKVIPRDNEMEIFIPVEVHGSNVKFNLLAVWNFYSVCKQGRFRGVTGPGCLEFSALQNYSPFLKDPCIIIGDWNLGPTFAQADYLQILHILEDLGIKSLYHEFHKLDVMKSNHPTYRTSRGKKTYLHHLDHMFASQFFCNRLEELAIDDFTNVIRSDHAPFLAKFRTS